MNKNIVTKDVTEIDHARTGRALREYRETADLSLRAIANEMGISPPYLSDLERGNRKWSEELVDKFMKAMKNAKTDKAP